MLHLILEWLQPALAVIAETALLAVLGLVARYIPLVARLYADQRNRDALHRAVESGVDKALTAGEMAARTVPGVAAVETALAYIERSVPGALKHFFGDNASAVRDHVTDMILAKLGAKAVPVVVPVSADDPLAPALVEAMG